MLPNELPWHFFNPLVSKHRDNYIRVLFYIESVLEQSKSIAVPRAAMIAELRRVFQRENYVLDVSDEEDYDEEPKGDFALENLTFATRKLLHSGWIDVDESGDYSSDSIFVTLYGKKLAVFLKDLAKMENQSGYVVNTYSNLRQVRQIPDIGFICIQNAYDSTQHLLISLEMMYSKIKEYYSAILAKTKPEDILESHLNGYVQNVVEKLIFPIKVDDSIDRFKGKILNVLMDIESDTSLLETVISTAMLAKRINAKDDGWHEILKMLSYIKHSFEDIDSYVRQLDEKNQTYIRITRQKLAYMLSMDTSVKGDIVSILRDAKERTDVDWGRLSSCFNLFDVKQITENSVSLPRNRHIRDDSEALEIEETASVSKDEIDAIIDTHAAMFTMSNMNDYVLRILDDKNTIDARDIALAEDDDYLMTIYMAMNSTDRRSTYVYETSDGSISRGIYRIPGFTLRRKGELRN